MATTRTEYVIQGRTQGIEQAQQKISRLSSEAKKALDAQTQGLSAQAKNTKEIAKETAQLEGQLQSLTREQQRVVKAMEGLERSSRSYKELNSLARDYERTLRATERQLRTLNRATREQQELAKASQGAFTQGFMQGVLPQATLIQRGPGAMRQFAGVQAGQTVRGIGQGITQSPFTGGMSIAGAIPFIGGIAQAGMGAAGQALALEQQRAGMVGIMGGTGIARGGITEAEQASADEAGRRATAEFMAGSGAQRARQRAAVRTIMSRDYFQAGIGGQAAIAAEEQALDTQAYKRAQDEGAATRERVLAEARQRHENTYQEQRRAAFGDIQGVGTALGLNVQQTEALLGGIVQAGGGTVAGLGQAGMMQDAVAASRLFGADEASIGALFRGQRRGGIVDGRGSNELMGVLGDAIALGLEGSEQTEYLQTIAQGIDQFRSTGMPFNPGSMARLSAGFGNAVGVEFGQRIASTMLQRGQQLATGGAQGATDLLALQAFGFQGGGIDEYMAALRRAETGDVDIEAMQGLIQRFGALGGGAGALGVQQLMSRVLGQNVGITSAENLLGAAQSGTFAQEWQRFSGGAGLGRGEAERRAGMIDPAVVEQAALENRRMATGAQMLPVVQAFEDAGTKMTNTITTLVEGPLLKIGEYANMFADRLPGLIGAMDWMISKAGSETR